VAAGDGRLLGIALPLTVTRAVGAEIVVAVVTGAAFGLEVTGGIAAVAAHHVPVVALLVTLEVAVAAHAAIGDACDIVVTRAAVLRQAVVEAAGRDQPRHREPRREQGNAHPSCSYAALAARTRRPMVARGHRGEPDARSRTPILSRGPPR